MPLTPADVHNVIFKKPPIGKRGYDEDDVDAFLDEVERELARLIEENNELKTQTGGAAPAGPSDGEVRRVAAENADLKQQVERLRQEKKRAEHAAVQAQQVAAKGGAPAISAGLGESTGEQQALRVLMMAQRTAEEHESAARRDAEKMVTEARTKAEELSRDARATAESLERDARARHQEAMGGLDAKRTALQKHIEELKEFERQYRTRLKAYLETQLRDLDGRTQAPENEVASHGSGNGSSNGNNFGPAFALAEAGDGRR